MRIIYEKWYKAALHWSSYCYRAKAASDKMIRMVQAIIRVSKKHPRYGYRRIRALLVREGWQVSRKFVQKVRRAEGLMGAATKKEATAPGPVYRQDSDHRKASQPCLELGFCCGPNR